MRKLWTAMNVPMNIGKSMDNRRTWMTKMAPFPGSWFCRTPGAIFVENDPRLSPPLPSMYLQNQTSQSSPFMVCHSDRKGLAAVFGTLCFAESILKQLETVGSDSERFLTTHPQCICSRKRLEPVSDCIQPAFLEANWQLTPLTGGGG